jgi:hypothetical protein
MHLAQQVVSQNRRTDPCQSRGTHTKNPNRLKQRGTRGKIRANVRRAQELGLAVALGVESIESIDSRLVGLSGYVFWNGNPGLVTTSIVVGH